MNIFFGKRAKGKDAPVMEVISDDAGQKGLAFGLYWRKLVTSGGREQSVKLARAAAASHYIFRSQQTGYAKLAVKHDSLPRRIYPASVIAARQFMGDSLCLLEIGDGVFWLALTRNGNPTSVDYVIKNVQASDALNEARKVLAEYAEDDGRILVYTNIDHHGLDHARELSVYDLFDAALDDDELLVPLPKPGTTIPLPVLYVGAAMALGLAAQSGYQWFQAKQRERQAAATVAAAQDPYEAWTPVIDAWKSSVRAPDARSLDAVRESLGELKINWNGWGLGAVVCKAGTVSAASRSWTCRAAYLRGKAGMLSRDMAKAIPDDWTATFTPLNEMMVLWTVKQDAPAIDLAQLGTVDKVRLESISQLQRLQSALSDEPKFNFVPVVLQAPVAADATAMKADERVAGLQQANLVLKGPLRSIDAVTQGGLQVDWTEITLTRSSQLALPTLNTSMISAEVKGVLYANQ